ncbi:protection of telomeres protein 1-like [Haliotis rubra]|uniref:protection of telomeres protein 1-like n=1 Tax=Haliotis rubra TaxID=36100 RepID=UPI001EE527D0|nr:protection of telomeres protein 1-like [Haliotis rubra]
MTTTSTDTKAKLRKYLYTTLGDVQTNTVVDVFGVVKFLKPPKQTRGTDHIMILSLIDETLFEQEQKLKCVLFLKPNKVPQVEVGSVVRFHRLKIGTHQGELQGGTSAGFSWLVFNTPESRPQSSSPSYTYSEENKKRVKQLFDWSSSHDAPVVDAAATLSDIAVNGYFNLTCQVVSTCVIEDGVCFLLRVWDGTKPIYPVRELDTEGSECDVASDSRLLQRADGHLYDVCVFDDHFCTASRAKPGMFLKFYNLHAAEYKSGDNCDSLSALPTIELVLHRGTMYGRGLLFLDAIISGNCSPGAQLPSTSGQNKGRQLDSTSTQKGVGSNSGDGAAQHHASWADVDEGIDVGLTQKRISYSHNSMERDGAKRSRHSNKSDDSVEDECYMTAIQLSCDTLSAQVGDESRCMQETATVILNHPHVKPTRIRDVLTHTVPFKFRVKARVVDCQPTPTTARDLVSVYCSSCHFMCRVAEYEAEMRDRIGDESCSDGGQDRSLNLEMDNNRMCPRCTEKSDDLVGDLELTYVLRLLLHDGSGWLVANLWRGEATKFLKDIPPEEVLSQPATFTEVKDALSQICPAEVPIGDKPWVECCIAAYTGSSSVNYHIFDTVVV